MNRFFRFHTLAMLLASVTGTAVAQSAPALQIAPAHPHDPSTTVVQGDSAPALRIARPHGSDPRVTEVRQDAVPAIPRGANTTVHYDAPSHRYRGRSRATSVTCESYGHGYTHCSLPQGRVHMSRRLSSAACREGRDWGLDRHGVWVDNGCRAIFRVD